MTTRGRGHGEGGIRKRPDGLWEARVSVGYTVDGEGKPVRQRQSIYGKTRQEVAEKLTVVLRDRQRGLPSPGERLTVKDVLIAYLAEVKTRVKPSTYRSYEQNIRLYLLPAFGRLPVGKLTPQAVQVFLDAKVRETTRSGRPFSAAAILRMRAVLRQALTHAEAWDQVGRNVAKLTRLPRGAARQPSGLSLDEARALLAAAREHRLEALFRVALTLGLRQGEALGLRWTDVDLAARRLDVREAMQRVKDERTARTSLRFVTPKSLTSRRTVPLPDVIVAALTAHRTRQAEERARSPRWHEHGLVFCTGHGTPLDGPNVTRYFQRVVARAGLPHMTYHDLRHACTSLMAAQGVPVEVARAVLGHSDIRITLNVYTHVFDEQKRQAATTMDRLFGDEASDRGPVTPHGPR